MDIRLVHVAFFVTWFLLIFAIEIVKPTPDANSSTIIPAVLGLVGFLEIGLGFFLRSRFIEEAEAILQADPENQSAKQKWRTGNLLAFCFAETITLFGVVLKYLGYEWKIAGVFFGVGLLLLILWTPRQIAPMPPGVH